MLINLKKILLHRIEDGIVVLWGLALGFYFFSSIFLLNAFEERFYLLIVMFHFSTLYFWGAIAALDHTVNKKKQLLVFRYPSTVLFLTFLSFVCITALYLGGTDILDYIDNINRDFHDIAEPLFFIITISAILLFGPFLLGYIVGISIRLVKKYCHKTL